MTGSYIFTCPHCRAVVDYACLCPTQPPFSDWIGHDTVVSAKAWVDDLAMSHSGVAFAVDPFPRLDALGASDSHQSVTPECRAVVDDGERLERLERGEAQLRTGHDRDHDLFRLVEAARCEAGRRDGLGDTEGLVQRLRNQRSNRASCHDWRLGRSRPGCGDLSVHAAISLLGVLSFASAAMTSSRWSICFAAQGGRVRYSAS